MNKIFLTALCCATLSLSAMNSEQQVSAKDHQAIAFWCGYCQLHLLNKDEIDYKAHLGSGHNRCSVCEKQHVSKWKVRECEATHLQGDLKIQPK